MEKFITIDHFRYGNFITEVKASQLVLDFIGNDIEITKSINTDEWYRNWLLKLDEDKDGKADEKFGKSFELIYCNIIENPEDFLEKDAIAEDLKIEEKEIIADGTQAVFDSPDNKDAKFWVRWIIKKR